MRRSLPAPRPLTALLTLLALGALACGDDGEGAPDNPFLGDRPLVIAHGGGQGIGPDHTLLTYGLSVDEGTDVLELDVHLSADGHVVVMHDETVDRLTDGEGRIKDKTLAELKTYDAGHAWSPDRGETHPWRGQGLEIPTMDEVFTAFPDAWYVIEIKQREPSMVDPFVEVLDAHGMRGRAVVASFSSEVMAEFRARAPDVLTSFGESEATELFFLSGPEEATYEPPAKVLQLPRTFDGIEVFQPFFLDRAARFDLPIHAWTINDAEVMGELLDLGIRGLITDYPGRARGAVDAHLAGE